MQECAVLNLVECQAPCSSPCSPAETQAYNPLVWTCRTLLQVATINSQHLRRLCFRFITNRQQFEDKINTDTEQHACTFKVT